MAMLVFGFATACILVMMLAGLWLVALAFLEDWKWGLACMIFSPAILVFILLHLDKTWRPALIYVVSFVLGFTSLLLVPVFADTTTVPPDNRAVVVEDGVFRGNRVAQRQPVAQSDGAGDLPLLVAAVFGTVVVGMGVTGAIVLLWTGRKEDADESGAAEDPPAPGDLDAEEGADPDEDGTPVG